MGLDFKKFPGGRGQTKSATVRFFPGSAPEAIPENGNFYHSTYNRQIFKITNRTGRIFLIGLALNQFVPL